MNPIETFRVTVTNAISAATAAGTEPAQLHRVLFDLISLDPADARGAAESLDQLIDGEQDELAEQLVPARDLLRRLAGN